MILKMKTKKTQRTGFKGWHRTDRTSTGLWKVLKLVLVGTPAWNAAEMEYTDPQ
ncbi:hypothetical protein DPMN_125480 [Dreissena polymorpha]|uniref:Uncharacterized protein n=1 Tax=Dreissena polymorpha TaxID=45954 RepID=A0A9D4H1H8_DREPO|nr:hypothetical protein DPMN_125480 [Dreissena polymorpha]